MLYMLHVLQEIQSLPKPKLGKRCQQKTDERIGAEATTDATPTEDPEGHAAAVLFRPGLASAGRMPTVHGQHHSLRDAPVAVAVSTAPGAFSTRHVSPRVGFDPAHAHQGPVGPGCTVPFLRRYGMVFDRRCALYLRLCHRFLLVGGKMPARVIGNGCGAFLSLLYEREDGSSN